MNLYRHVYTPCIHGEEAILETEDKRKVDLETSQVHRKYTRRGCDSGVVGLQPGD